jgi:hypothetical protein
MFDNSDAKFYFLLDENNYIITRFNTVINKNIPNEAIEVSKDICLSTLDVSDPFKKWLYDGETNTVKQIDTVDRISLHKQALISKICNQIDTYILETIKQPPYYYGSIEEIKVNYVDDPEFKHEAVPIYNWCMSCQKVWVAVKTETLAITDTTTVDGILPPFPQIPDKGTN